MATTIAEYYLEELLDWNRSIRYFINEIDEFNEKLNEVIRRNSIIDIAAKVETQQNLLGIISEKFTALLRDIESQSLILQTDHTLIDNNMINEETESKQYELRSKMKEIEKEYIDAKFDCYNFLSGTLKK